MTEDIKAEQPSLDFKGALVAKPIPTTGVHLEQFRSRQSFDQGDQIVYVDKVIEQKFDDQCRIVERISTYTEREYYQWVTRTTCQYDEKGYLNALTTYETYFNRTEQEKSKNTYEYDKMNRLIAIYLNSQLYERFEYKNDGKTVDRYYCPSGECTFANTLTVNENPKRSTGYYIGGVEDKVVEYTRDEQGNLIEEVTRSLNDNFISRQITRTYDKRKSPSSLLGNSTFKGMPKAISLQITGFEDAPNNVLKEVEMGFVNNSAGSQPATVTTHNETTYRYEYNTEGYPIFVTSGTLDKLANKKGYANSASYTYQCK